MTLDRNIGYAATMVGRWLWIACGLWMVDQSMM